MLLAISSAIHHDHICHPPSLPSSIMIVPTIHHVFHHPSRSCPPSTMSSIIHHDHAHHPASLPLSITIMPTIQHLFHYPSRSCPSSVTIVPIIHHDRAHHPPSYPLSTQEHSPSTHDVSEEIAKVTGLDPEEDRYRPPSDSDGEEELLKMNEYAERLDRLSPGRQLGPVTGTSYLKTPPKVSGCYL